LQGINEISPELRRAIVGIVDERLREIHIPREDFHKLTEAVEELAQAQAKTEERMGRVELAVEKLAQAQARTEKAVEKLSQAQAKTEERMGRVELAVEKLAQAQTRTEERMGRVELAVEKLSQAQARTEIAMEKLAQAQTEMRKEIGGLGATIGFGLEDIARVVLPGYLERHYNIYVDELNRRFFRVDKTDVEVNLYGEGRKNGRKIIILGETKSRIYEGEVKKFIQQISKVVPQVEHEVMKVMFGYLIHPTAMKLARKEGIILVASYQR